MVIFKIQNKRSVVYTRHKGLIIPNLCFCTLFSIEFYWMWFFIVPNFCSDVSCDVLVLQCFSFITLAEWSILMFWNSLNFSFHRDPWNVFSIVNNLLSYFFVITCKLCRYWIIWMGHLTHLIFLTCLLRLKFQFVFHWMCFILVP